MLACSVFYWKEVVCLPLACIIRCVGDCNYMDTYLFSMGAWVWGNVFKNVSRTVLYICISHRYLGEWDQASSFVVCTRLVQL